MRTKEEWAKCRSVSGRIIGTEILPTEAEFIGMIQADALEAAAKECNRTIRSEVGGGGVITRPPYHHEIRQMIEAMIPPTTRSAKQ